MKDLESYTFNKESNEGYFVITQIAYDDTSRYSNAPFIAKCKKCGKKARSEKINAQVNELNYYENFECCCDICGAVDEFSLNMERFPLINPPYQSN